MPCIPYVVLALMFRDVLTEFDKRLLKRAAVMQYPDLKNE